MFLQKSKARIEESIKRVAKKKFKEDPVKGETFINETMSRLSITTTADDALKTADLVVEGVTENLELSKNFLQVLIHLLLPTQSLLATHPRYL